MFLPEDKRAFHNNPRPSERRKTMDTVRTSCQSRDNFLPSSTTTTIATASYTNKMVRQVQPLRISKPATTASPEKSPAMSRPLAEISSGSMRRNSPSYNQNTRVGKHTNLACTCQAANMTPPRNPLPRSSLHHSMRMHLPHRHHQQSPLRETSGPHDRACRLLVSRKNPPRIVLNRLPPCLLSAAPASRSSSPLVG